MEIILLLIRIFLFAVFAVAGIGKLFDLQGSEKAVREFGVPGEFAKYLSIALPTVEICLAVLFLFTTASWFGAFGGLLLLLIFIGGMLWQMAKGNAPDCHCFGAIHSEPVSRKSVLRNVIFAALALVLVAQGWNRQGWSLAAMPDEFALDLILGLAICGLFGVAIYYLKKISEQQTQIIRRIELMEIISHEGGGREVERENSAPPASDLPVGAPAPDFALPDLSGREIKFEHLLMRGKPLVFFFASPTCTPCGALLPEIENWQKDLQDKLEIVFISSGSAKENSAKLGGSTEKRILLQKDREIGALFGALWTPTAILINPDGTIASHLAAGDVQIRQLFAQIAAADLTDGMIFIKNENGAEHLGDKIPEFALADINGETISTENLLGHKTVLTYWGLDCGWCAKMLDDLRDWEKTRESADEPVLMLVSAGDAAQHRELGLKAPILLDDNRTLLNNLGLTGTPSAILIDENGRIVSEIASGAENIWSLIGGKAITN